MGCFSAPKTSVQQASTMNKDQKAALKQLLGVVTPEIGQAQATFPGQRVADLSPLQQQGIDMASGIPGAFGQAQEQGFGALGGILDGQDFFTPAQEAAQNFFQNTVTPEVMGTFAQTGSANSGLAQKALSDAGRDVSLGLADRLSNLRLQQQGQQLGAVSQLGDIAGLTGQGAGQLQALGGLPQQQAQAQIGARQQMFQEQQPLFNPAFSAAAQLAGMPAFENIGVQKGEGLGRELAGSLIGGIGGAAGGFGGLGLGLRKQAMATILPAPMEDPIARGLRRMIQNFQAQGQKREQQKARQSDSQLFQNLINPEINQLNAQQRFAQGLPLLQGQVGPTGEAGPPLIPGQMPTFQTPEMQNMFLQRLIQKSDPSFTLQQENLKASTDLARAQAGKLGAEAAAVGLPTPAQDLAERKFAYEQERDRVLDPQRVIDLETARVNLNAKKQELAKRPGKPYVTGANDPLGFAKGTVLQSDREGNLKIVKEPKTITGADFQIVQDDTGQFVRLNKLNGDTIPLAVKGKTDPESAIFNAFTKRNGNPESWSEDTWNKYNESAAKIKISDQRPLPSGSVESLNAKAEMVGILQEMTIAGSQNQDLLGPIAGRYTSMKDAIGLATGREGEFVQLIANKASYLRELAGAAFTETEAKLYLPMFAGLEDNPQAFFAKTQQMERILMKRLRGEVSTYNNTGYKNLDADNLLSVYAPGSIQYPGRQQNVSQPNADAAARETLKTKYGMTDAEIDAELGVK